MALTENEKRNDKREKPVTKVIIRRLPPSMDQGTFLSQVSPIPEYSYIYTAKGDSSLGEYAFNRVYINFVNARDIYDFKERFDNYVFLDNRGHEYPAVVEYAPFQKIPKKRGKVRLDPKCGTIESDPIFQEFLESLNKPKEQEEKPEYTLQLTSENKNDVTTPLLEYIKSKRAQKMRIREVRREERKRREFDKRKERYDDRKKLIVDQTSSKSAASNAKLEQTREEKSDVPKVEEKVEKIYEKSFYKTKEKKYDEKKYEERRYDEKRKDIKLRYPKKEYHDRDYKRQDEYRERDRRSKYDDYKKEDKSFSKRVKKYSERREERKLEVQKSEQKKSDCIENKKDPKESGDKLKKDLSSPESNSTKTDSKMGNTDNEGETNGHLGDSQKEVTNKTQVSESRCKESDLQSQRRIRNKDRPTIAIYRPGMLSKRKQNDTDSPEIKDSKGNEPK